jgi:hypothetical protein
MHCEYNQDVITMSKVGNKIVTCVMFDPDILERIGKVKGRHSRSAFINDELDKVLRQKEKELNA